MKNRTLAISVLIAFAATLLAPPFAAAQYQEGTAPPNGGQYNVDLAPDMPRLAGQDLSRYPEPLNRDPIAQQLAKAYAKTGRAKTIRKASYVIYPFGKTQPVVPCTPLRACIVQLEPGEQVISAIAGDPARWLISTSATGRGGATPLIVLKPTDYDLTTNLVISTDRRIYSLMLDSPPETKGQDKLNPNRAYTQMVRFYYPEAFVRQQKLEDRRAEQRRPRVSPSLDEGHIATGGKSILDLNFDYSWEAEEGYPWEPLEVFDDGEHTYIKLPEAAGSATPVLFDMTGPGKMQIANYSIRNNFYIMDRVIKKAALVLGIDKKKKVLGFIPTGIERERARLVIRNRKPMDTHRPPPGEDVTRGNERRAGK